MAEANRYDHQYGDEQATLIHHGPEVSGMCEVMDVFVIYRKYIEFNGDKMNAMHFSVNGKSPLQRSFWMQEIDISQQREPMLTGSHTTDIAIVGGGFVGLWTALTIKERAPNLDVMLIEQDVCGGGASGRNGGIAMSWWPKVASLLKFADRDGALFLAQAAEQAISDLQQFCQEHAIDAEFRRSGWLWTATTEAQKNAWEATIAACASLGAQPFEAVSASTLALRTGSTAHLAGVFEKSNATVQPAKLVWGLRRVALERGVKIYEGTAVNSISYDHPAVLRTQNGEIKASSVVLATNAWSCAIPEIARKIVPVNSAIVVTEPVADQLMKIGWSGGEAITDSQLMVDYYRTTREGRVAFGKGTGVLARGSAIDNTFSSHQESINMAEEDFRKIYPVLTDTKVTHSWSGPIDRSYDSLPLFGTLEGTRHIHYGVGWSGNGISPSQIGGRILASLALESDDEWSRCALVNRKARMFPPEPFRYLGGSLVRNAVRRKEMREGLGLKPRSIDVVLARLAPSGLEDKS